METKLKNYRQGTKYEYMDLVIDDKRLQDWELATKWNYGIDCIKTGSAISIILRKKLKVDPKKYERLQMFLL